MIAAHLATRICNAVLIHFVEPCPDGWVPRKAHCHENAATWVCSNPSWSISRGWIHVSGDGHTGAIFDAHSVVRDPSGKLWDVTLGTAHSFIEFDGRDEEFDAAVRDGPWRQVIFDPTAA